MSASLASRISRHLVQQTCQQQTRVAASTVALQQIRADTPEELSAALPYDAVPHPVSLPVIGSLYRLPWMLITGKDFVKQQWDDFDNFGDIYKDKLGNINFVYTQNVDAIEKVHRIEGKYPQRIVVDAWVKWREQRGLDKGILIESDGERWRRMRTQLDKQMMRPRKVAAYVEDFHEVADDFVQRLRTARKQDSSVDNMDEELFHWSLETIGTVIYETRLGNFNDVIDPDIVRFIQAVQDMFRSTEKVIYFPPEVTRMLFRKWYDMHWNAWDVIFAQGKKLIDIKLDEIDRKLAKGEEASGFLSALVSSGSMSQNEIYANVGELMAAAVDTTSNTMQWVIEMLSRHPDIQQRLHDEVVSVVPRGQSPTYEDIQRLPLVRAVIKEILRLYPVAGVVTKIIQQDAILCGYHIPKQTTIIGSTFLMGRNPDLFPDPLTFKPDRWLRDANSKRKDSTHAFAWLPFGHGPRMCVGRRIAELEMHILLIKLSQEFQMNPIEADVRQVVGRGLLVPDKAVNVQYIDRQ